MGFRAAVVVEPNQVLSAMGVVAARQQGNQNRSSKGVGAAVRQSANQTRSSVGGGWLCRGSSGTKQVPQGLWVQRHCIQESFVTARAAGVGVRLQGCSKARKLCRGLFGGDATM